MDKHSQAGGNITEHLEFSLYEEEVLTGMVITGSGYPVENIQQDGYYLYYTLV